MLETDFRCWPRCLLANNLSVTTVRLARGRSCPQHEKRDPPCQERIQIRHPSTTTITHTALATLIASSCSSSSSLRLAAFFICLLGSFHDWHSYALCLPQTWILELNVQREGGGLLRKTRSILKPTLAKPIRFKTELPKPLCHSKSFV